MGVGFILRVLRMIERAGRNYLWIPATLRTDSGELVEHGGRDAGLQDYGAPDGIPDGIILVLTDGYERDTYPR